MGPFCMVMGKQVMSDVEFEALLTRRSELSESQAEYAEEYQDPACALRAYQLGIEIERLTAVIDEQLELESAAEYVTMKVHEAAVDELNPRR